MALASATALLTIASGTSGAAPTTTSTTGATAGQKPCQPAPGYKHFFKLDSAENFRGRTVVRVTPETCSVNTGNDEDVTYTPTGAARSFTVGSDASVQVFSDINSATLKPVAPKWLVHHRLTNSPHFSYRVDSHNRITAMREIYHP
ncbi:hypothetical protein [Streptomyces sp. DW26H14]|uniref:hypothetical protein n=1 Tax=Streptomyces sp. DW26H14 TaxID=3435395 RepID=UPI00403E22B3